MVGGGGEGLGVALSLFGNHVRLAPLKNCFIARQRPKVEKSYPFLNDRPFYINTYNY